MTPLHMHLSTTYYTLIGSLPALPRSIDQAERLPISRLTLVERLKMLDPKDARVMEDMLDFLIWERQPVQRMDEEIVAHYLKFMQRVDHRFARELVHFVMAARTILAGLRCRRLGLDPPPGIPDLSAQMVRNWTHTDFRLGNQFPWISEVDRQLVGESPFDLERTIIEVAWRHFGRLSEQHFFTFDAVLIYLMRWELVYRWTKRDAQAGHAKFEQLVTEAMGDFANIFAQ